MAKECADCAAGQAQVADPTTLAEVMGVLCDPCLRKVAAIEVRIPDGVPSDTLRVGAALASIRTAAAAELGRRERAAQLKQRGPDPKRH